MMTSPKVRGENDKQYLKTTIQIPSIPGWNAFFNNLKNSINQEVKMTQQPPHHSRLTTSVQLLDVAINCGRFLLKPRGGFWDGFFMREGEVL